MTGKKNVIESPLQEGDIKEKKAGSKMTNFQGSFGFIGVDKDQKGHREQKTCSEAHR